MLEYGTIDKRINSDTLESDKQEEEDPYKVIKVHVIQPTYTVIKP